MDTNTELRKFCLDLANKRARPAPSFGQDEVLTLAQSYLNWITQDLSPSTPSGNEPSHVTN